MQSVTDADLVVRLKANDESAYQDVVARYSHTLYGYVYRLTGDHHLAEDIVGETYLRVVEHIDSYSFYGAPLQSWLFRIARNLAINALKTARFVTRCDDIEAALPTYDDPASSIVASGEIAELQAALAELTVAQQQVLLLRFVREHSPSEVAQIVGKSETAVKQLQLRALRSLQRHLLQQRTRSAPDLQL